MRFVLAALMCAVLFAGCITGPASPGGGDGSVRVVPMACPATAPAAEAGAEPAPLWRPGDRWEYAIHNEAGAVRGHVTYEMLGCARVGDVQAYEVRETHLRLRDYEHNMTEAPHSRTLHYDVRTLSQVWDVCGAFGVMGACKGRHEEWNFPLHDNKTWSDSCCGDVLVTLNFRAQYLPDATLPAAAGGMGEAWRLEVVESGREQPETVWTYAPAVGLFAEKLEWRSDAREDGEARFDRWVLVEHHRSTAD